VLTVRNKCDPHHFLLGQTKEIMSRFPDGVPYSPESDTNNDSSNKFREAD
jgi:hypothetical protein